MARKPARDFDSVPLTERLATVMAALEAKGSEQTRRTFARHGMKGPAFGVKVADHKVLLKELKGDQALALALWDTGNSDARYLAGLLADARRLTPETLHRWAAEADWYMLSDYTVAWNAAESGHGWALGKAWIAHTGEFVQSAGWCALAGHLSLTPDADLDLDDVRALLESVPDRLAAAPNRARAAMVMFVIGVAWAVQPLFEAAMGVARRIGKVPVDVGDTECKIPVATDYIQKLVDRGDIGRKRTAVKC